MTTNLKVKATMLGLLLTVGSASQAQAQTSAPRAANAYIVSPANGSVVSSPVHVVFGLQGMGIAPAGVERDNTGHHHLLIDARGLPKLDEPLGGEVIHFGGGQTETSVELEPGEHTLQLILGDHNHRPHKNPVVSEKVTITVK